MVINTIVLAISGDRADDQASSRVAADIARSTGASLHLVHAWNIGRPPMTPGFSGDVTDPQALERSADLVMQKARADVDLILGRRSIAHIEEGRPEKVIRRVAEEVKANLVVVRGNVRHGSLRTLIGSISEEIVHHSASPVLLVHGDLLWPPREIVACFDGSPEAEYALDTATYLATAMALPLRSIRVAPGTHRPHLSLEDRPHSGPVPRPEFLHGHPAKELELFVGKRPPALVAMGTSSTGALPMTHLGSVATHLLRKTSAAMLIVPPTAVAAAIKASA